MDELTLKIRRDLKTKWMGKNLIFREQIDSTNTLAKELAENGAPEGTLVFAEEQTGGRGRRGRSWCSPKGTAVSMTLILRPWISPECVSMVTLVMGLAAAKAVNELYPVRAGIKWPNDVVLGGKKICGILTELRMDGNGIRYLVVGIGINANVPEFPAELRETAVSLSQVLGKNVDRAELMAECLFWFEEYYERFIQAQDLSHLQKEYEELLLNRGRMVKVLEPGNEYTGVSRGINEKGELLVQREDGTVTAVYAGEVSVRGIYGYV